MHRFSSRFSVVATATCALLAATIAGCVGGHQVRVPFHQMLAVHRKVQFSLNNPVGTIQIDGWNRPSVEVAGDKTGPSRAAAEAIAIDIVQTGSAIAVRTHYPGGIQQGGATYVVHVPADTPLDVQGSAGTLRIEGMRSDVKAAMQAGTISVAMARLTGTQRVDLRGTTGTVQLLIPHTSNATIDAQTSLGKASLRVPQRIGDGSARVTLRTTIGTASVGWL